MLSSAGSGRSGNWHNVYKKEHDLRDGHSDILSYTISRSGWLGGVAFKICTRITFPLSENIKDGTVSPAGIQVPSRVFLEVTSSPLAVSSTVTKEDYPGNL